jgi:hypothetical protein
MTRCQTGDCRSDAAAQVTDPSTTQRSESKRRNSGIGLLVWALVFVALAGPGQATAILGAKAAIQGEGRFYRATETLILFSGFFQGAINVTKQQGDLVVNAASLTCPGTLDVHTAAKTTEG